MSRKISISDEVYRRLEREMGDQSISEFLEDLLDDRASLSDVTGQRVLDHGVDEEASKNQDTR